MKRVITLKEGRECHACERQIKKGEQVTYWEYQQENGKRGRGHWCSQCSVWAKEVNDRGEMVWTGDFLERRLEMENNPQPEAAKGDGA